MTEICKKKNDEGIKMSNPMLSQHYVVRDYCFAYWHTRGQGDKQPEKPN